MRVTVSFWFFAVLTAAVLAGGDVLLLLLAALLHELGHAAAVLLTGGRIAEVRIGAFGARMIPRYRGICPDKSEALVLLAGPGAGLLAAAIAHLAGWRAFFAVNLALSLFNLLPLDGLDGGRLLELLCARCGDAASRRILLLGRPAALGLLAVLALRPLWGRTPAGVAASALCCMAAAAWLQRQRG